MKKIRLEDKGLEPPPSLIEVASLIDGGQFNWWILDLYAHGYSSLTYSKLEDEVEASEYGILVPWATIVDLASTTGQVIDGFLVASKVDLKLSKFKEREKLCDQSEIVLDLFDSSIFEIRAKNDSILERIASHFERKPEIKVTRFYQKKSTSDL